MTNNAKHTPGPWTRDAVDLDLIIADSDGLMVACVSTEDRHHEINDANASLVAAAPDLLAALEQALAALNTAPRFKVQGLDSDSYRVATVCARAVARAMANSAVR